MEAPATPRAGTGGAVPAGDAGFAREYTPSRNRPERIVIDPSPPVRLDTASPPEPAGMKRFSASIHYKWLYDQYIL